MFKFLQRLAILSITLLAFAANPAMAQLPMPTLSCVTVIDNSTIKIHWSTSGGLLDGHRVYYKATDSPGDYEFLDYGSFVGFLTMDIPVSNAYTIQYEVYVRTYKENEFSDPSMLLTTIPLKVYSQSGSNGGIAIIEWSLGNHSTFGNSTVYRSTDNLNFIPVGITSTNSFNDTIDGICDPTVLYYFVQLNNEYCDLRSMRGVSTSPLQDNTAPPDPTFRYITINEDGLAVLNWSPSEAQDLAGYQIEVNDGNGWVEHATVGITTSFIDDLSNNPYYQDPCTQVVKYVLKAVDECENTSAQGVYQPENIHNTIWLRVDLDGNCQRKATLTWNRYNNMNPPVSYQIIRKQNGSSSIIVGSIDDDGSEEFSFTDDFLIPGELYTYHISAYNAESAITSESCRVEVVADPKLLTSFDLNNVSVYNNDEIQLKGSGGPPEFINEVAIYRSATTPDDFELLTNVSWDFEEMVIPETTAEVNETAYYYQLVALDECGYEMERSLALRSIYLELEDLGEGRVRLNWNAFEGWGDNLLGYDIFRMTDGVTDPGFPKPTLPETLVYNDLIDPTSANGRITYYVEASSRNDEMKSQSNEVLLPGEAEVLMPNAFRPASEIEKNRIFTPIVKNADPANYRFVVYNRWGQMVFETNDPLQGWDGRMKGQISPLGIYAYVVTYAGYDGVTHSQKGVVNLLR